MEDRGFSTAGELISVTPASLPTEVFRLSPPRAQSSKASFPEFRWAHVGELVTLQLHWGPHVSGTFRDNWRGGSSPRRKLFTSTTVLGELHLVAVARPTL